ncbi:MAG: L-threonylcarbamoyladenylate synthase [Acidimicrobiales bacterium]
MSPHATILPAGAPDSLARAGAALADGAAVVIPTDTVYGIAVLATRKGAADQIFAAKGRPSEVALPVLVADRDQAESVAELPLPAGASALMQRLWPGALTVVVPRRRGITLDIGGEEDLLTVGLRCPDHRVARALCRAAGPLATTSANLHGQETPTSARGVAAILRGAVALVLDGGECAGAPSTVVDAGGSEPRLLRAGRLPWTDVISAWPGSSNDRPGSRGRGS